MAVPNIFGTATSAIPLSQLDTNFATAITLGNTAVYLGNTTTSLGNVTLTNVTISSGNVTITGANVSGTANVSTLVVTGNQSFVGTGNRITGDFSNATVVNRVQLQSSTTNGQTGVIAIPNGTSTAAQFEANSDSSGGTNASITSMAITATDARFSSGLRGTGTYLPMTFYTGGSERARIDTSGNVGIGTSSPAYKLDVVGSVNVPADSSYVLGAGSDRIIQYRSGANDILYSFSAGNFYQQSIASSYHAWFTGNNERMRITSAGVLLVGRTTQTSSEKVCFEYSSSVGPGLTVNNSVSGNGTAIQFSTAGSGVGNITTGTSNTAYNTSSDYRLKNTIAPMTGALAKVALLKPVTYKWNIDGSSSQGFIAHELQEVVPDCVNGEKDAVETYTDEDGNEQTRPKYQGIDTSFLVATLTAAIQEQQALITALTARITALESN
jgi:hypothetical protein